MITLHRVYIERIIGLTRGNFSMKVIIMIFPSVVLLPQGPVTFLNGSSSHPVTLVEKLGVGVTNTSCPVFLLSTRKG